VKRYSDDELDALIRAVIRARLEGCEPPPVEESWARFREKLRQKPGPKFGTQKSFPFFPGRWSRLAAAAVLVFALAAVLSFNPGKVRALGYKVLDNVEVLLSGTLVNLRGGVVSDDRPKPPPPPGEIKEIPLDPPVALTLEQARARTPFPLRVPGYLPPGYRLEKTVYQKTSPSDTARVTMEYRGPKESHFTLTQFNFVGGLSYGYGYDSEDTVIKEVMIGPHRATMAQSKIEFIHLMWIDGNVKLDLDGRLPAQEAVKIASSIYDGQD